MKGTHPFQRARDRFFDNQSLDHPLKHADWRGCVLDRDKFGSERFPETLWDVLIRSADAPQVQICGYFSGIEECRSVPSEWKSISAFMRRSQNYSPEYVLYDASSRWAILADPEVTTVVMEEALAEQVDVRLSYRNTSLLNLTLNDFSKEEILAPGGRYVRSILGIAMYSISDN